MSNLLKEILNTPIGTIGLVIKNNEPVKAFYRTHSSNEQDYQSVYTSAYECEGKLTGYLIDAVNNPVYRITEDGLLPVMDTSIDSASFLNVEDYNIEKERILNTFAEILLNSPGEFFIFGDLKSSFSDFAVMYAKDGVVTGSGCGPDAYAEGFTKYLQDDTDEDEGDDYYADGNIEGDSIVIITTV